MKRFLLLLVCTLASSHVLATYTQTITLEPGWNAVYLEVVPEDNSISAVFSDLLPNPSGTPVQSPLQSVWRFFAVDGVTGVPDNPGEGLRNIQGWRAFYPPNSPVAAFSELYTVRANNAYLIELGGTSNVTITLTGTPQLQRQRWTPDAFTFTGFGVDPLSAPTFATYFAPSPAHLNQPIYGLNDADQWELVSPGQQIEHGKAYWVFSRGPTEFKGPLEVVLDPGFNDLDFGTNTPEAGITLINRAPAAQEVRLTRTGVGEAVPLEYQDTSDPQAPALPSPWLALDDAFPLLLPAEGWDRLEVAPRRSSMQANRVEQVLVFTTLDGARVLVPAAASLPVFDPSLPAGSGARLATGPMASDAGLWIGTAAITSVNQTQSIDGTVNPDSSLAPVAQDFPLRVIVHIDDQGVLTLVSQVVQLFEEGSTQDVPGSDDPVTCVPGRTVLITEDESFGNYAGLTLRGDGFVGNRVSTVAYDFGEKSEDGQLKKVYEQTLIHDGANGRHQTLIRLPADSASNPFFHRFHPDHDNRNVSFAPHAKPVEVPEITRTIALYMCGTPGTFLNDEPWLPSGDPACDLQNDPAAGTDLLAGKFEDVIGGLHQQFVRARGDLRLRRLAVEQELNPDPLDLATCVCDLQGVCP